MNLRVKQFIEENVELIEQSKFEDLFIKSLEYIPSTNQQAELVDILNSINIDTTDVRLKLLMQDVLTYIEYCKKDPFNDSANSWSRLDYMLEELSTFGFGVVEAKQLIIDNSDTYGIKLTALDPQYGWQGAGDYDLGYFDKKSFERMYLDE